MWTRFLLCFLLIGPAPGGVQDLTGTWQGETRSFPPITNPRLKVELTFHGDASVSGKVGDATIVNGRVRLRRPLELRWFNHFTYRVDFRLSGPISQKDGVARDSGRINLDMSGEELRGWFISSGPHVGPPSSIQLVTRNLVLKRYRKP